MANNLLKYTLLLPLLLACGSDGPSNNTGDEEPPSPPTFDYEEDEPNNTLANAQFIQLLPEYDKKDIHGYLSAPDGADCFYFFLNPVPGDDELLLSFNVDMTWYTTPKVTLYQTIYDELGEETGEYLQVGTFVGEEGYVEVTAYPIEYDFFRRNDLFFVLEGFGDGFDEYVIEFFTF